MGPIPFFKYHGLGNDFVVLDGISRELPAWLTSVEAAQLLCDRRRGLGADGVLLVLPPREDAADARMRVLNADGSEPQMCGNGLRCVARFLHERQESPLQGRDRLLIDTGAGLLRCDIRKTHASDDLLVCVDMGRANLDRQALPMRGEGPFIERPIAVGETRVSGTAISMGNPHFVIYPDTGGLEQLAWELGPALERHPDFPERTNVELARLIGPQEIDLWVWERGVGITQACGTGACATVVAAVAAGRCEANDDVQVNLPGGPLQIRVEADYRVWMTGPATFVYRGILERLPTPAAHSS